MTEFNSGQQDQAPQDQPLSSELRPRRGRPSQYSPEERADRAKRATKAQSIAVGILRQRHEKEYEELYEQAKKEQGL